MRTTLRITGLVLLASSFLSIEALALVHDTPNIITANRAQGDALTRSGMNQSSESDSVKEEAKFVAKLHLKKELSKISWQKHSHISKVVITGNQSISSEKIKKIVEPYLSVGIARGEAQKVMDDIELLYINEGYFLPVVHLYIEGTTLKLVVVEGKIREVLVVFDDMNRDKKVLDNKLFLEYIKKIELANPIKTRDLERYLILIDNIHGYSAQYELEPLKEIKGNNVADIAMRISTKKGTAGIAVDNSGTQDLGINQINFSGSVFNPISNDALVLSAGTTNRPERMKLITAAYDKILNSYGTSAAIFGSYMQSNPNKSVVGSKYNISQVLKGQLDQFLILHNDYSAKLEIASELRNITNYIENGIKVNQYRYPLVSVGGTIKITDPLNIENWFYPYYKWTLNKIHAASGPLIIENFDKRFNFFTLEWYRTQPLPNNFSLSLMASYQTTNKNLPLEHSYSINSGRTARGYATGLVSGDQGISGMAELRYSYEYKSEEAQKFIKSIQPFIFYDITKLIKHNTPTKIIHKSSTAFDKSNLSGTGFGARLFLAHGYYVEATAQFPLLRHININGTRRTNKTIYRFNISKEFNF